MTLTNFHTHSDFSDGINNPEIYIQKAIDLGFEKLGFSDHAPFPKFAKKWNIPMDKLEKYYDELNTLKSKYQSDLQVLTSLEIDYIPDLINPKSEFLKQENLDYTIGSIHFLGNVVNNELNGFEIFGKELEMGLHTIYKGNVMKLIEDYYKNMREMLQFFTPNIVGHIDKIKDINKLGNYLNENDAWYQDEIDETLKLISEKNVILEINTKGMYNNITKDPYPSHWLIEKSNSLNINMILSSDAHHPEHINSGFEDISKILTDKGIFVNSDLILN